MEAKDGVLLKSMKESWTEAEDTYLKARTQWIKSWYTLEGLKKGRTFVRLGRVKYAIRKQSECFWR